MNHPFIDLTHADRLFYFVISFNHPMHIKGRTGEQKIRSKALRMVDSLLDRRRRQTFSKKGLLVKEEEGRKNNVTIDYIWNRLISAFDSNKTSLTSPAIWSTKTGSRHTAIIRCTRVTRESDNVKVRETHALTYSVSGVAISSDQMSGEMKETTHTSSFFVFVL